MSEEGYVFGSILGAGPIYLSQLDFVMTHNLMVVAKLPPMISISLDPILVSASIFKMPVVDWQDQNTYRYQMIHFGLSMNHFDTYLGEWIIQFEALLRQLYWMKAYAYITAEFYLDHEEYCWEAHPTYAWNNPPQPVQSWEFKGGPRSFKE
jgi:hypothetical protein